jgi:hypothetical protein
MKKPAQSKKAKKNTPAPMAMASLKIEASPELKPLADATAQARMVDGPIPYLEVIVRERVTEDTMVRLFEFVRGELSGHQTKRVLVDLRQGSVALTISDMLGLAKMVATAYAGVLERLALLLLPQDVLDEKFFEPSVSSRGLPTFVTTDPEEAIYWIAEKIRPVR